MENQLLAAPDRDRCMAHYTGHLLDKNRRYDLSAKSQALYFKVLYYANLRQWEDARVPVNGRVLAAELRMHRAGLMSCIAELNKAGLISYEPGIGRSNPSIITLLEPAV